MRAGEFWSAAGVCIELSLVDEANPVIPWMKNVRNEKLWEYGIVYNPNKSLVREHCSMSISSNTMFEQENSADGSTKLLFIQNYNSQ